MITRGEISPRQLCSILFDQGVLDYDDANRKQIEKRIVVSTGFSHEKDLQH